MASKAQLRSQISSKLHRAASASSASHDNSKTVDDVVFKALDQIVKLLESKNQAAKVPMEIQGCVSIVIDVMTNYVVGLITITESLIKLANVAKVIENADDNDIAEVDPARAEFLGVKVKQFAKYLMKGAFPVAVTVTYYMVSTRISAMANLYAILYSRMMTKGGGVAAVMISKYYGQEVMNYLLNMTTGVLTESLADSSVVSPFTMYNVISSTLSLTPPEFYNKSNALAVANLQHSTEIVKHGHLFKSGKTSLAPSSFRPISELTKGWNEILELRSPEHNIAPLHRDPATGMIIGQTDIFQRAILFSHGLRQDCKNSVACAGAGAFGSFLASFLPESQLVDSAVNKLSQLVGHAARVSGDEYVLSNTYSELLSLARISDAEVGNGFGAWNTAMTQLGLYVEELQFLNEYKLYILGIFLLLFTVFITSMYMPDFEEEQDVGEYMSDEASRIASIQRGFLQGPSWNLSEEEVGPDVFYNQPPVDESQFLD